MLSKKGVGLLPSAFVAGVVFSLVAQRSNANLLAEVQLAFAQAVRPDDVLVPEGGL